MRPRSRSRLRPLTPTDEEQAKLKQWARNARAGRSLSLRARIVLRSRDGYNNREIARQLRVSSQTVGKWRARFAARGLAGLLDEPRSGAPRSISDDLVEAVLTKTLHEQPDQGRWSSRRLASELGISQRAVLRIWRTFDL